TTADILGRDAPVELPANESVKTPPQTESPAVPEAGAQAGAASVAQAAESASAPPPAAKTKPAPRKPKPIAVAAAPKIGNYELPRLDFLQSADTTLKPTETKEELMANARLMQQTLAQFDIE